MNINTVPTPPGQVGFLWRTACWVVVLLGASAGLFYFHYQFDWSESAGVVGGISRVVIFRALGAVALLALLALFWVINRQTRRKSDFHFQRARQAEYMVGRLLEEIRIACGEAPSVDTAAGDEAQNLAPPKNLETPENPLDQWQTDNVVQGLEINRTGREIVAMADALGRIHESASAATECARNSAGAAKQGAAAVHNAIAGINDTHSRIQDAAERLKQIAQSARRFDETVNLIRDVTEQTGVLSLNASLRGLAGEAGAAEEMQRLADRAARGAGEIAELVEAIRSDSNSVIKSLEIAAGGAAAGVARATEAGRALAEIESASWELLGRIDLAVSGAAGESARAQTVGERMDKLKIAAQQAGANASGVAAGIEKLKAEATDVAQWAATFKPSERR